MRYSPDTEIARTARCENRTGYVSVIMINRTREKLKPLYEPHMVYYIN